MLETTELQGIPEEMANVVVVGAQWGDEGKGKIVDWLSEQADIVVRFQGGHNAGHTLVINGETYKLALLPSGVLRPSKLAVIGNGVVFDPQAFLDEVARLKGQGVAISPENLRVAENVTLILPLHRELDALRESSNAATAIGTTRRGIGPAYEDKVGRRAIRLMDLADLDTLPHKIDRLLAHHNALRRGLNLEEIDGGGILKELTAFAPQAAALCRDGVAAARPQAPRGQAHPVRGRAGRAARRRPRHLPLRHLVQHGGGAGGDRHRHGSGRGRLRARHLQGLYDAGRRRARSRPNWTTRSAARSASAAANSAPIPGGKRRCGWFDAVLVRQTVRTCGITGLALTKLDILDGFDSIEVCTGYMLDGKEIDHLPAGEGAQARVVPIYETIEGWKEPTANARSWADLPAQAIKYVRRVEELVGCPIALLSTSPEREDTILVQNPFEA